MSTGPGRTQQAILAALGDGKRHAGVDLADALGISASQLRRAAHSLQARGLAQVSGTNRLFIQTAVGSNTLRVITGERRVGGGTLQLRSGPVSGGTLPPPTTPAIEQVDDDNYAERVAAIRAEWQAAVHPVDRTDDAVDLDT